MKKTITTILATILITVLFGGLILLAVQCNKNVIAIGEIENQKEDAIFKQVIQNAKGVEDIIGFINENIQKQAEQPTEEDIIQ